MDKRELGKITPTLRVNYRIFPLEDISHEPELNVDMWISGSDEMIHELGKLSKVYFTYPSGAYLFLIDGKFIGVMKVSEK